VEVGQFRVSQLLSPNGKWEAETDPSASGDENANLVVKDLLKKQTIELGEFNRTGQLIWTTDSNSLIFIDSHSPEDDRILIFCMDKNYKFDSNYINNIIRDRIEGKITKSGVILFYNVELISVGKTVSIQVRTINKSDEIGSTTGRSGNYTVTLNPPIVIQNNFYMQR
jgi:hypothetical protein